MAEEQNSLQEETVKLRKKIETKFKMVDLKQNKSARIIQREKIKEMENSLQWNRNLGGGDSRSKREKERADD